MTIDATFWVMISFFAFLGLLVYFKIPRNSSRKATFGEIALVFETTRTANIIAVSDCTCWTVNRDEFAAIMTNSNKQIYIDRYDSIIDSCYPIIQVQLTLVIIYANFSRSTFLRKIEFLNHLSDYEVAKIAHVAWDESYKKGEFIVKEKDNIQTTRVLH